MTQGRTTIAVGRENWRRLHERKPLKVSMDEYIGQLLDDDAEDLVATPIDTHKLSLNPGYDEAPKNPLCPVCNEQIRPISNSAERRFVCGCEQVWQFTFGRVDEPSTLHNGGDA
jgi:hypothetical protein